MALQGAEWSGDFAKRDAARTRISAVIQVYRSNRDRLVPGNFVLHDPDEVKTYFASVLEPNLRDLDKLQAEASAKLNTISVPENIKGECAKHLQDLQKALIELTEGIIANEYWNNPELMFSLSHQVTGKAKSIAKKVKAMSYSVGGNTKLQKDLAVTFAELNTDLHELRNSMVGHLNEVPQRPRNAQINTLSAGTRERLLEAINKDFRHGYEKTKKAVRWSLYAVLLGLGVAWADWIRDAVQDVPAPETSNPPTTNSPLTPPSMTTSPGTAVQNTPSPSPQSAEQKISDLQSHTDIDLLENDIVQLSLPTEINEPGIKVNIEIKTIIDPSSDGMEFKPIRAVEISPDGKHRFQENIHGMLPTYKFTLISDPEITFEKQAHL